jgi:hypothetical protein
MALPVYSPYLQTGNFPQTEAYERQTLRRLERLCRQAVSVMKIDLAGTRVLTEAATGPFATTAVIAALAGAVEVRAVVRDSRWGAADVAIDQVRILAEQCGVAERIVFSTKPPSESADGCDLVTNLGFLRPISRGILEKLSPHAAVSLMWEPWEFRADEIDCDALDELGIPLIATNEHHPEVRTFEYLGPTIGRLLFDAGIEIVNSRLVVIASDPFGAAIEKWLKSSGAAVTRASVATVDPDGLDALVIAEHRDASLLLGSKSRILLEELARVGVPIIRLCGRVDILEAERLGVAIYPGTDVDAGAMTITTAYAGPRPVIDLHAAGLKAGGEVVRARRLGLDISSAIEESVRNGFGLAVER